MTFIVRLYEYMVSDWLTETVVHVTIYHENLTDCVLTKENRRCTEAAAAKAKYFFFGFKRLLREQLQDTLFGLLRFQNSYKCFVTKRSAL